MDSITQATALIKNFEGFRAHAYICPAGKLTIGYGTTSINGQPIPPNQVITLQQAEAFLHARLIEIEAQIKQLVKVPLTANQEAALISFVYNVGYGAFKGSSLLGDLNAGDFAAAAHELVWQDSVKNYHGWIHGNHSEVIPGLVTRRLKEKALFLS